MLLKRVYFFCFLTLSIDLKSAQSINSLSSSLRYNSIVIFGKKFTEIKVKLSFNTCCRPNHDSSFHTFRNKNCCCQFCTIIAINFNVFLPYYYIIVATVWQVRQKGWKFTKFNYFPEVSRNGIVYLSINRERIEVKIYD